MSFQPDLAAYLKADSAIAALVGDAVWPMIVPEGQRLPCVIYSIISDTPVTDLDDGAGDSLDNFRVQIDAWALDYETAAAVAEAVRMRLQTAAATFSATPTASGGDSYESETKRYRRSRDYSAWYTG